MIKIGLLIVTNVSYSSVNNRENWELPWWSSSLECASTQRALVQSLVRELGSHMLCVWPKKGGKLGVRYMGTLFYLHGNFVHLKLLKNSLFFFKSIVFDLSNCFIYGYNFCLLGDCCISST